MIKNLTPHAVNVIAENGSTIATFPSEGLARCSQSTVVVGEIEGFPITSTSFGEVEGLPEPQEGVRFIVSRLVLSACAGTRNDLLVPNDLIRDDQGNIVGCKSFAIN